MEHLWHDRWLDLRAVCRGHDRYRYAQPHRQQRGDGLLRPDLGQCQRHWRDGLARHGRRRDQEGAPDHGRPRRGGQHDQGHHQGCGDCLGRDCGRQPLRFIHHRCGYVRRCASGVPQSWTSIRVSETGVFIGLLLGGALPWLFSSLSIRAVSRAAGQIVRRSAPAVPHPGHHGRHRASRTMRAWSVSPPARRRRN